MYEKYAEALSDQARKLRTDFQELVEGRSAKRMYDLFGPNYAPRQNKPQKLNNNNYGI